MKNMFDLKTFIPNDKQRNAEYFSKNKNIKSFRFNFKLIIYIAFSLYFIVRVFILSSIFLHKIMNNFKMIIEELLSSQKYYDLNILISSLLIVIIIYYIAIKWKILLNIGKSGKKSLIKKKEESNLFYFKIKGFYEKIKESINNSIINKSIKNNNNTKFINQRNKRIKFLVKYTIYLLNFIEIIIYIILLNLINIISLDDRNSFNEYKAYNITLKIKGTGTKKIFSSSIFFQSNYHPDEVYINGYKQDNVKYSYELNQTYNFIGLTWNKLIDNTRYMFEGCSDIIEIDLSNFNTSIVVYMNHMFYGCSSLISLNLSNFDTSKVNNMNWMFRECSSLTSLNLSNFDTSKLNWMHNMFTDCTNLEYINMINFKDSSLEDGKYYDIFKNVPVNIVICINKDNINKIYSQIENILCHIEDCTDNWKLKQKKLIDGNNTCINKCSDNNLYENNKMLFKLSKWIF